MDVVEMNNGLGCSAHSTDAVDVDVGTDVAHAVYLAVECWNIALCHGN